MNISKISMMGNYQVAELDKRERKPKAAAQTSFNGTQSPISNISNQQLANALRATLGISFGSKSPQPTPTVSLIRAFGDALRPVRVCGTEDVGEGIDAQSVIGNMRHFLVPDGANVYRTTITEPAAKITYALTPEDKDGKAVRARTQVRRVEDGKILFEMLPKAAHRATEPSKDYSQLQAVRAKIIPDEILDEKVDFLNTKGKLTAVVRNPQDVLLTNDGSIKRKSGSRLEVDAARKELDPGASFKPFSPRKSFNIPKPGPSVGVGGEVVIGMEDGRFNKEIIHSVAKFVRKVQAGKIPLPPFVAAEGADKIQLAMLAGGFGSRAEYTNASSTAIMDGEKDGTESTKGVFKMPTGLTPMETTFVSLHMAGLLDCSAEKLGIGKNIKFYLNKSGINKGNGGFSIDMYNKSIGSQHTGEFIFPNDSVSRMPKAIAEAAKMMNRGDTAIAMIAKKVPAENARGNYGIMQLDDNNQILEFAEKPKVIPEGYADDDDKCLTNTFQFVVSNEAFSALKKIEPYFSSALKGKETRDWSKQLVPTIMVLSRFDDPQEMRENLPVVAGITKLPEEEQKAYINFLESVPDNVLEDAKATLKGQKVYAVPTDEPWVDAGQLDAMYDVVIDIADGKFELSDWERNNVIDSINPQTGLVAMTPKQKARIEENYDIQGKVMAVLPAEKINGNILEEYENNIIINE